MVIDGERAWREGSEREESRMTLACATAGWWFPLLDKGTLGLEYLLFCQVYSAWTCIPTSPGTSKSWLSCPEEEEWLKRSCHLENSICQAQRHAHGGYMLVVPHQRGGEALSSLEQRDSSPGLPWAFCSLNATSFSLALKSCLSRAYHVRHISSCRGVNWS